MQLRMRWHQRCMNIAHLAAGRKFFVALSFLLFGGSEAAWGQKGENAYSAPGMPVVLARCLPAVVAAKATPIAEPWLSDPLPRFWKNMDSLARQQDAEQMWQALKQRVRYPPAALRSQVEGTVWVRILLTPAGTLLSVSITETTFIPALADRKASKELEVEALRVAQLLRFQPRAGAVDSVTIPISYRIQ